MAQDMIKGQSPGSLQDFHLSATDSIIRSANNIFLNLITNGCSIAPCRCPFGQRCLCRSHRGEAILRSRLVRLSKRLPYAQTNTL